jgi:hypothetical protein
MRLRSVAELTLAIQRLKKILASDTPRQKTPAKSLYRPRLTHGNLLPPSAY